MSYSLTWNDLNSVEDLDRVIDDSRLQPALIFKYRPSAEESIVAKETLEKDWSIPSDQLKCYLVDVMKDKHIASQVSEIAGIPNAFPQVLLFADEVAMYDESHDMINVKKIKLALKIINRTFKWMETRV